MPKSNGTLTTQESDIVRAFGIELVNENPLGIYSNDLTALILLNTTSQACQILKQARSANKSVGNVMGTAERNDCTVDRIPGKTSKGYRYYPLGGVPQSKIHLMVPRDEASPDNAVQVTQQPESEPEEDSKPWCLFVFTNDLESTKALTVYENEAQAKKFLSRWEIDYPTDDIQMAEMKGTSKCPVNRETVPFKM